MSTARLLYQRIILTDRKAHRLFKERGRAWLRLMSGLPANLHASCKRVQSVSGIHPSLGWIRSHVGAVDYETRPLNR